MGICVTRNTRENRDNGPHVGPVVVFVVPKMVINGFLWFRTGFRWFRRGRKWFLRLRHGYRRFQNGYRVCKTGYREYEKYENHFGTRNVVRYFCIAVYTA